MARAFTNCYAIMVTAVSDDEVQALFLSEDILNRKNLNQISGGNYTANHRTSGKE